MIMSSKWTSRKFWISVAAFLASIATSISGFAVANSTIATVGIVCGVIAAAIYAAAEAYVDGQSISTTTTQKVITATSESKDVVQSALIEQK